jgi:hypothetical protein
MSEAIKFDEDKPRMDLVPWDAVMEVARVLALGSVKYGDRNWEHGFQYSRLYGAVFRHMALAASGESADPETGRLHLSHAACSILMLLATVMRDHDGSLDDMPKVAR